MFDSLTQSFKTAISKIRFSDDEKSLKRALDELRKALLGADVHHKVVKTLLTEVEIKTKRAGIGKDNFIAILKGELETILTSAGNQGFVYAPVAPTVVLMTGLQGAGKTTTTGKLANYLKQRGKKVLIVAADLQRLAAVEQLRQVGASIEVDVYSEEGVQNPVEVMQGALKKGKAGLYDVILVDSAGRLAIDDTLMDELRRVKEGCQPFETFYVADSLTGQDAVKSAATFHEKIGLTGVILSKYDGDSKGGVALGIAQLVGIPLRFIGLGEKMADFEVFIPERITNRLLGGGDIIGLAEKVSHVVDAKDAKKITQKIKKGEFNFNDFLDQLESMKKLGSLKSLMGMIPGMGQLSSAMKDIDLDNSKEIKRIRAMISSMTPKERETPSLLSSSRKQRIAGGSGLSIVEVNRFLKQFENAAKMAKKLSSKGGMNDLMAMMSKAQGAGQRPF